MKIPYSKLGMAKDYTELDVLSRELSEQITLAVESLPVRQKEVFILRVYEGNSYKHISLLMGCNENTIRSLNREARKNLRKKLQPYKEGKF